MRYDLNDLTPSQVYRNEDGTVREISITKHDGAGYLPKAPYYVLSNDAFLSGWGWARGRINTVVLPCENYTQAEKVATYAQRRGDQRRVRITTGKPRLRPGVLYSVIMQPTHYSAWYGLDT